MITTDILIVVRTHRIVTVLKQVVKIKMSLIDALPQPGGQCSEIYPEETSL
jgi:hypothetical protein